MSGRRQDFEPEAVSDNVGDAVNHSPPRYTGACGKCLGCHTKTRDILCLISHCGCQFPLPGSTTCWHVSHEFIVFCLGSWMLCFNAFKSMGSRSSCQRCLKSIGWVFLQLGLRDAAGTPSRSPSQSPAHTSYSAMIMTEWQCRHMQAQNLAGWFAPWMRLENLLPNP